MNIELIFLRQLSFLLDLKSQANMNCHFNEHPFR